MSSYDVVGYAYPGYCQCEEHREENNPEETPIFEGCETDSDILCDTCYGIAFSQGLPGNEIREACLIQGKNIWDASERKEVATTFLRDSITLANNEKNYCKAYALTMLEKAETVERWGKEVDALIAMFDTIPPMFPDTCERYQDTYAEIQEDVCNHVRSVTER